MVMKMKSSRLLHRVVWWTLTHASEELIKMAVIRPSETPVNIYQTTQCNIPGQPYSSLNLFASLQPFSSRCQFNDYR
jgi:hypothetical protein